MAEVTLPLGPLTRLVRPVMNGVQLSAGGKEAIHEAALVFVSFVTSG
jgi:hypothetical protein